MKYYARSSIRAKRAKIKFYFHMAPLNKQIVLKQLLNRSRKRRKRFNSFIAVALSYRRLIFEACLLAAVLIQWYICSNCNSGSFDWLALFHTELLLLQVQYIWLQLRGYSPDELILSISPLSSIILCIIS